MLLLLLMINTEQHNIATQMASE